VLVDRRGRQAHLPAERFSAALEPALGDSIRQLILSDVRIPLAASTAWTSATCAR
jgi:hypothetical protein